MGRSPCCAKDGIKRGPWAPEEDQMLVDYIKQHGHGNWRTLAKKAGLARCGKSCRLRWTNYLRPDIKRGRFSLEEEDTIIHLHSVLGNKWSAIAARLPGRTDNEIKNYWNTHVRKRLLRMGIDPVTHTPRLDLLDLPSLLASSSSVFRDPAAAELDLLQNIATGLLSAQNSNLLHHNLQLDSNTNPELQEAYQQLSATCNESMVLDEAQLMLQRLADPWHDHFTMKPNPSVDYQGINPFHSRPIVDGGFDTYWTYSQLSSVLSTPASSSSTHVNSSLTSRSSEGGRESDCCDLLEFQLPDLLNMSNYI